MKGIRNGKPVVMAILLALAALIGAYSGALAEDNESVNYAVRAILPDNQINDEVSHFELLMAPGREQVLQVVVKNKGSKDIEVAVEANAALSNSNGVIEFVEADERDPSMAVDFSKIVTVLEPLIAIPAGQQAIAEFLVKMPKEPYEGAVYGGFMFTKLHQDETSEGASATGIRNIYRYVIGARLYESVEAVEPEFELLGAGVAKAQIPALRIDLRNPRPVIARQIALAVDVYSEQGGGAVLSATRGNLAMAPNSWMPYTLYLDEGQKALASGAYRMRVGLEFEGRTWQFETPLVIE